MLVFIPRCRISWISWTHLDSGVQASTVVSLNNITAVDLASADTAVVGALGTGETALGPAVRPAIGTEEGVFLLQTEPELFLGVGLHQTSGLVAVVELVGGTIGIPGLAQNEDVVTETEGVGVNGNGTEVDIGVVTGGLAGGGAVEVPFGKLINGRDGLGESLCLATAATDGVDPNVLGLDLTSLVEGHVLHEILRVGEGSLVSHDERCEVVYEAGFNGVFFASDVKTQAIQPIKMFRKR
jgi:hypothetical protein